MFFFGELRKPSDRLRTRSLGITLEDLRIGLAHPLAAARYAFAVLRRDRIVGELTGAPIESVAALYREVAGSELAKELTAETLQAGFPYHAGMISSVQAPTLYVIVRIVKPELVVETGVASGFSTAFILDAMERNGLGRLYSIDLRDMPGALLPPGRETGWLVPLRLRRGWELVIGSSREELPRLLRQLGSIDIFLHDSDHSLGNMLWEYWTAWPYLKVGGLLLSHDVQVNAAFRVFSEAVGHPRVRLSSLGGIRKTRHEWPTPCVAENTAERVAAEYTKQEGARFVPEA